MLLSFTRSSFVYARILMMLVVVVVMVLPDPFREMGCGGTPRRPNSRITPKGLDHRSRIERKKPKTDLQRGVQRQDSRGGAD